MPAMLPARLMAACLAAAAFTGCVAAHAAPPSDLEARSRAYERATQAVVGLQAQALEDARTNRSLGRVRQGSGVVIDQDLVLTIGYLILEAEEVLLTTADERSVPARVVGYDAATGFGLVQALAPLKLPAVPLGDSSRQAADEDLLVASGGDEPALSMARMVSRRAFAGFWEYHLEAAVFTAPARGGHSGAGLFNGRGELLGIGSLVVGDALGRGQPALRGNMFVPAELLKPILAELRQRGTTPASRRAWLGLNCVEADDGLRVLRVAEDSPAEAAGLAVGDRILRIDGTEVKALDVLWKRLWSGGAAEREVLLEVEHEGELRQLRLQSVDRTSTLRRAQGV